MEQAFVVENGVKAKEKIDQLAAQGYTKDDIYIIAHDDERTDHLIDNLNVNDVGISEEGLGNKIANIFRSQGDELRSRFEALGLSEGQADEYEKELDKGKVVVIANKDA